MTDRIGTEIAGYRIESLLARGGMGEVYLATQSFPERKVALKLLPHDLAIDAAFRERFIRESNAAASVEHPNIVPVYGAGEASGELYIAMRYVDGEDLRALLDREGPIAPERAVRICSQIADALEEAHEHGLVHRDVKPGNILVSKGDRAYLTDFGLIRRSKLETDLTKTGQFMGTVDYIAPEQIKGDEVDGRADVYSLGCVLYECLVGEPPFRKDTEVASLYAHLEDPPPRPSMRNPAVPTALDGIVLKAIAKRPTDRFATGSDLAAALRAASVTSISGRRSPARKAALAGATALLLLVAGLVITNVAHRIGDERPRTGQPSNAPEGPSLNSLIRVDPEDGTWTVELTGLNYSGAGVTFADIAVGEGAVWVSGWSTITRIDPATGDEVANLPASRNPVEIGYHSVWTADSRIDLDTDELFGTVPSLATGQTYLVQGLSVGDEGVWTILQDGSLVRRDPADGRVIDTVRLAGGATAVATGEGGVWVVDGLNSEIYRLDPKRDRTVWHGKLPGNLTSITVGEGYVWVLDRVAGQVTPIDASTNEVGAPIRVGQNPFSIDVGLGAVWVADQGDGDLWRIDPLTKIASPFAIGAPMLAVAADEQQQFIWVAVGTASALPGLG